MKEKPVPFVIVKNSNGTYAVVENPMSKEYGRRGWAGEKVVRSPYNTSDEARESERAIAGAYQYAIIEKTVEDFPGMEI